MLHRCVLVVPIVAFALLGGCGGDDDADDASGVAPATFQRDANALCEEEHARVDAMFEEFPAEPTPRDMQDLIGTFAASFRDYRDGLVAIGPPEGQEAAYEEYVGVVGAHLADLERGAEDPQEAERLFNEEGDDPLGDLERTLGLDVCASR